MCLLDCKCKSLNRLGENRTKQKTNKNKTEKASRKTFKQNRNTGYPAQDPTANIYHIFIRGGSWAGYPICCCCFMLFIEAFLFDLCCLWFVMFSPSLFKLLHLQSNKHI